MKGNEVRESIDTLTIFTMLVRCPRGGHPNATCPFVQFRDGYSLEEKFQLAESFPKEQRRQMMDYHNQRLAMAYAKQKNNYGTESAALVNI